MTRKFSLFAVIAAAAALLAGCADPVVFSEVFQLEEGQKLYTAYNIWYTNPADINCMNIQQGRIIPIGTEIEPVKTTSDGDIVFKDKNNQTYTIRFSEGTTLTSMREYIKMIFDWVCIFRQKQLCAHTLRFHIYRP
jgi:hypothetical protein